MIQEQFYRTAILLGDAKFQHLANKHVLIAGVGGVGGYVVEALVRAGIMNLTIIDHDVVDITNINRQLIATLDSVGIAKVALFREKVASINPNCNLITKCDFITENNLSELIPKDVSIDYVIDCIDTVASKIALLKYCKEHNIKVMSSMGAGNRYDVTKLKIADISKTRCCRLARIIRTNLKKDGIKNGIRVVYSEEQGSSPLVLPHLTRPINGTISYLPAMFGLMLAGVIIKEILDAM